MDTLIDMSLYSDQELRDFISDHFTLHKTSILPPESKFRKFTQRLCEVHKCDFNFHLAETFLAQEVFKRFLNK